MKKKFTGLFILTIIVALVSTFYFNYNRIMGNTKTQSSIEESTELTDKELQIHYIDVGQGDSVFIEFPDETCMLIDAGNPDSDNVVINYIDGLGYTQIDYLIVTHGDNDHVGEIPDVIEAFEIVNIYRPYQVAVDSSGNVRAGEDLAKVYNDATVKNRINVINKQAYGEFIRLAYDETYTKNGNTYSANVSTTYDGLKILPKTGNSFTFEFFGPLLAAGNQTLIEQGVATKTLGYASVYQSKPSYSNLIKNEASPIMLLEHSSGSYLFTGDATTYAEDAVVGSLTQSEKERFENIDVYHVGHHGASNSSGDMLMSLIKPSMSVISVGEGNSHGHPTDETIQKLESYCNKNIYRSDKHGNILVSANSTDIQIKTNNVVVGNLSKTQVELPPDEYWYLYVAGVTLAVFISGAIYILSNGKIKVKAYKTNRKRR